MRYVLYGRKSSESEDRQIQSIDDQLRILRELAQMRGFDVVEEITESKSAKAPGNRPGFERMLHIIEKGRADGILCWSVNRLTRNPIDSGKLAWMLQNGKLQAIQTPEKQYLPTDNVLIFSVETGTANQYIIDLKKSVARGTENKLAKGWFPHRAPEGYLNNLYNHTIEADGERFELLQRAWRLLLAGTHTPAKLIDLLNDDWGYRTRQTYHRKTDSMRGGDKLSVSTGYRLFSNIFYAGYFRHGNQVYKGSHPAMISLTEFEEVQSHLRGQRGREHRHKHTFPYVGLMRCGTCGMAITADRHAGHLKRGNYIYYHCNNAAGTCSKRGMREEILEARIDECLARITITDSFRETVRVSLEKWIATEFGGLDKLYQQQTRTLIDSEKMLSELIELRLRGMVDDAVFLAKQRELQQRVSALRVAIGKTQERLDRTRATVNNALDFRRTARAQFLTGDGEKRREIARALGVRYVYSDGEVFIEMNPLLTYMQAENGPKKTAIEPFEIGSESSKKTFSKEKVSIGRPDGKEYERLPALTSLNEFFNGVWERNLRFHASTTGAW